MNLTRHYWRALGVSPNPTVGMNESTNEPNGSGQIRSGSNGRMRAPRSWALPENWGGTALVVLLSLLVLQAARWSIYIQPQFFFTKPLIVLSGWALFVWTWCRYRVASQDHDTAMTSIIRWWQPLPVLLTGGLLLFAGPLVEWFQRRFQVGDPPEFIAFDVVLSAAMLLSVAPQRRWRQAALVTSAFAALMVTFAKPDPAVYSCVVLFGVVGLWRMMTTYWEGIESKAIGSSSRQLPFRFSILGMTVIVMLLLAVAATALKRDALGWTSSWSFFSGGEQWSDPYATGGVGDGENLVAATKSAQSEGPIDSDMFIESKKRSLYDVIAELNGEKKPTPRTETSQAVGIRTENYLHNHGRLAKVQKNSSSFQTTRTSQVKDRPKPDDALSDALLLVTGEAPTHLTIETFDLFDGETWFQSEAGSRRAMWGLLPGDTNEWYCFKRTDSRGVLYGFKNYQVAFVHLQSERIPLPPLTEAWSIGHVNQPRFYRPTLDDGLEMTLGNTIPEFTLIRLVSRGFRLKYLPMRNFWRQALVPRDRRPESLESLEEEPIPELELPLDDVATQQLRLLADEWTAGANPGWEQVQRIVNGLRSEFTPAAVPESSLEQFLQERRGPNYLFATAAVLALRSQGIPARMVSGFYVDPKNRNSKTGKTAIGPQDAHFWAEVHVGDGNWIPVEPTPGYTPPAESLSWLDHMVQAVLAAIMWCVAHWPWALSGLLAMIATIVLRRRLWSALGWSWWQATLALRPQHAVLATLRILERSARERGCPRPRHQPVGTWLRSAFAGQAGSETTVSLYLERLHQQRYSPTTSASEGRADTDLCRRMVQQMQRLQLGTLTKSNQTQPSTATDTNDVR